MLAVLLTTLLAPTFGWEATAGQAGHGHYVVALADAQGEDDHEHQGAISDGESSGSHQHHGCAGHMFGHLSATLGTRPALVLLDAGDAASPRQMPGFNSSVPRRLDRPPHASDLA